jgi:hypothetical protein
MKCKYCEIELSAIDIRFGDSPEGLYMKGYCTDCYNRKDWIEENTIAIKSRDYWFKVLGMLSQDWALIDEQEGGKFKVLFINDHSNIFDELEFDSEDEAIEGLKRNDFERYADDKESQKFISSPRPLFTLDEIMKEPKYSSGNYWK